MLFDDPECLHHVGTPHPSDFSNGLNYTRCRQRDYNFGASFPYVYVRRFMFARRKIDDDAKSADTKDGGHPINLTYRMGYCNTGQSYSLGMVRHRGRFTQEDPIGLAGGLNLYESPRDSRRLSNACPTSEVRMPVTARMVGTTPRAIDRMGNFNIGSYAGVGVR